MVEDEEDASKYSMMVRTGVIAAIVIVGVDTATAAAAGGGVPAVNGIVAVISSAVVGSKVNYCSRALLIIKWCKSIGSIV